VTPPDPGRGKVGKWDGEGEGEGEREGRREREEERGREGGKGGEGIIHLLLPQAHTVVAAYGRYIVYN